MFGASDDEDDDDDDDDDNDDSVEKEDEQVLSLVLRKDWRRRKADRDVERMWRSPRNLVIETENLFIVHFMIFMKEWRMIHQRTKHPWILLFFIIEKKEEEKMSATPVVKMRTKN